MMRMVMFLLLSLLALTGCDGVLAADAAMEGRLEAVRVETDSSYYSRAEVGSELRAQVAFMVTNHSGQRVSLGRCGDRVLTALDRREGSTWVQYSGDACQAHLSMVPLSLSPGSTTSGTVAVREPGVYRLRLGVAPGGAQLMWSVTSNEFIVQ